MADLSTGGYRYILETIVFADITRVLLTRTDDDGHQQFLTHDGWQSYEGWESLPTEQMPGWLPR